MVTTTCRNQAMAVSFAIVPASLCHPVTPSSSAVAPAVYLNELIVTWQQWMETHMILLFQLKFAIHLEGMFQGFRCSGYLANRASFSVRRSSLTVQLATWDQGIELVNIPLKYINTSKYKCLQSKVRRDWSIFLNHRNQCPLYELDRWLVGIFGIYLPIILLLRSRKSLKPEHWRLRPIVLVSRVQRPHGG